MISFTARMTRPEAGRSGARRRDGAVRAPAAPPGLARQSRWTPWGRMPGGRTALAVWAGLILVVFGAGAVLRHAGRLPLDAFPPLHAHPGLVSGPLLPAAAVAVVMVAALPVAARRLPWRPLLLLAWLGSVAWAVVLALPDGLARPLTAPTEYLAGLPEIGGDPLGWLRSFTRAMQNFPTHVKGHPPLPTLILWTLQWAGLPGAGWAAALLIAAGGSAAAAIAITVRRLAGEDLARRAVPFLVLAPTALWVATSMDALFLGVAAWGVALLTVGAAGSAGTGSAGTGSAGTGSAGTGSAAVAPATWACAGGVLLGALPYLSYGLLSFFALPLTVLLLTRPARPVLLAALAGLLVVPAAFTIAGFSWWDGVIGTHAAWARGAGSDRPYTYFFAGDLAVLALLTGPATAYLMPSVLGRAAALVRVRRPATDARAGAGGADRRTPSGRAWIRPVPVRVAHAGGLAHPDKLGWLALAALAGMIALDVSGVTRGEVERIWIPYAAWVITVTAAYRAPARLPLLSQASIALLIEAVVRSNW